MKSQHSDARGQLTTLIHGHMGRSVKNESSVHQGKGGELGPQLPGTFPICRALGDATGHPTPQFSSLGARTLVNYQYA